MKKTKKLLEEYLRKEEMLSINKEVHEKNLSVECLMDYQVYEEVLEKCLRKVAHDLIEDYEEQFDKENWGMDHRTLDAKYYLNHATLPDSFDCLGFWCKKEDFQELAFAYAKALLSEEEN